MQIQLARNCWIPADAEGDLYAQCAAVLESTTDGVISSITAARLHGMWLPNLPSTIHVATATSDRAGRAMTRTKRPQFVAHRLQLTSEDITTVRGVTALTAARTWRDLASVLDLPSLVAAGDSVLRSGIDVEDLVGAVDRTSKSRGARLAKAALPLLDARSRSRPESHLRVAVAGPDMPPFEVNEPVYRAEGGWLAEPDLSLAEAKIALEYQGADHAEITRMRKDITREVDMRREDWLVLEFGPAEVFARPWQIRPEVRREVARRAPHLLRRSRRLPRVGQ